MFSPSIYGPAVEPFLTGQAGARELVAARSSTLFPQACFPQEALAGLWLLFDELDRSHEISQRLSSREASFWHAIMHRREPDPANAGYWFGRVGKHPIFPALYEAAASEAGYIQAGPEWDPLAWIDAWEAARRDQSSPAYATALKVQRLEWELLFDYCAIPARPSSSTSSSSR